MRRRDILLSGIGLAALGASEALRPRQRLVLLRGGTISDAIPRQFGDWDSQDADLVNPAQAGRLAKTLYSETVSRTYFNTVNGASVMVLAAYGDTQSDLLQLHRPESCYPAVGFTLSLNEPAELRLRPDASIPVRHVVANMEDYRENIIYWTRLGERLPQGGGDQRTARLQNAIDGYVADGILFRCSSVGESETAFPRIEMFVRAVLQAAKPAQRPALIGTTLAQKIA